jgi:hypothetical protein
MEREYVPEHEAHAHRRHMRWEDGAVYGLVLSGVYLLIGVLFFYGGKSKILDGVGAPPSIKKQFDGTFLETIPGIDAAWTIIGLLELAIFVLIVVSLIRQEFRPSREKSFLLTALALAIFTLSVLAIGQNVTGQTSGVASLFVYAGATAILLILVRLLPPYRPPDWLSGSYRG